ncbi:MAG: tetratricopeptide repeat protein [Bacteroidales bacterium]|nr:tetratricopeptide repeat protein [Bacteroidales bacterium]
MFSKHTFCILLFMALIYRPIDAANTNDLLKELKNAGKKERVEILIDLLKTTRSANMDSSFYYGRKAVKAARKINNRALEALALKNIGINHYFSAQADSAIKYYMDAAQICENINDRKGQANCLYNTGLVYKATGDYQQAISYFKKSMNIEEELGDIEAKAKTLNAIGNLNQNLGNFQKATENYLAALRINENRGILKEAAKNYNNLGVLFYEMGQYSKALNYYEKAMEIHSSLNNKRDLAVAYNNIGAIYHLEMRDYEKALNYYLKSLKMRKESGFMNNYDMVLMNTADVYSLTGRDFKAYQYHTRALERAEKADNKKVLIQIYNSFGMHYFRNNEYEKAENYLHKGLKLARKIGQLNQIRDIHKNFVDNYSQQKKYKKALEHHQEYIRYRDSIAGQEKETRIAELEKKYQSEKKEKEIELLKKRNEIQKVENRRRLYTIYGLIGFIILLVIITALLIREWRFKQKYRTIALEQKLLRLQMNPHFIFNLLTAIQGYIYKNEHEKAGKYLSMFARLIRSVLEYSRAEFISLDKEMQTLRYYLKLQQIRFSNKFDFEINVSPKEESTEQIYIPPMLAQPFIENSIEHGLEPLEKTGKIEVNFHIQRDFVILDIIDNGIGIEHGRKLNMTKGKKHQSLATSITADRLSLFKPVKGERIKLTIEDLNQSEHYDQGTRVRFKIPLKRKND